MGVREILVGGAVRWRWGGLLLPNWWCNILVPCGWFWWRTELRNTDPALTKKCAADVSNCFILTSRENPLLISTKHVKQDYSKYVKPRKLSDSATAAAFQTALVLSFTLQLPDFEDVFLHHGACLHPRPSCSYILHSLYKCMYVNVIIIQLLSVCAPSAAQSMWCQFPCSKDYGS